MRTEGESYTLDCRGVSVPMVWRVCDCGCGKGFGVKADSPQRYANRHCRPETSEEIDVRRRSGFAPHPSHPKFKKSNPKKKVSVKTFDPQKLKALIAECAVLSEAQLTLTEIAGSLNTKGFRAARGELITQKWLMNFRCRYPDSRGNAPTRRGKRPKGERPLQPTRKHADNAERSPVVEHPAHYNTGEIEVLDAIADWKLNFQRGNVIKYMARAGRKDPTRELEDLEKALFYLEWEINRVKGEQ